MRALRARLIDLVWTIYVWLQPVVPDERLLLPYHREGKFCRFDRQGGGADYPTYRISSQRGQFSMGRIEWSPQWRAYSFVSAGAPSDIVRWNALAVAEVYVFLKELGASTGRFV